MKPNILSIIFGTTILLIGESIRIWAVSYAGSETRTTEKVGGSQLVTQGPFRFVRNPLYLGNILIYTGIGIMSYSLFPYLQLIGIIYFTFQYYCIILNEEEYLINQFNEKYKIYLKYVKRFIPIPRKTPDGISSNINFNLKDGIRSEKRTLQSIIILIVIITTYYILTN